MQKVKVSFKGGVVKSFNLSRVDILPNTGGKGPSMLHLSKRGDNSYVLSVTPDVIPDISFLEKIEIVEE